MQLASPRLLAFTDATTGDPLIEATMPTLSQVEACLKLGPVDEAAERAESPIARQRRIVAQLVALLAPPAPPPWKPLRRWRHARLVRRRRAWLRGLQYHQLVDLWRKMLLCIQGLDLDAFESFEAALEEQKKKARTAPQPATDTNTSPNSNPSSAASPSITT